MKAFENVARHAEQAMIEIVGRVLSIKLKRR